MIRQIIMSKSKDMPTLYFLQHRPLFLNLRFSSRLLHPLKIRNNFAVPFKIIWNFRVFTIRSCNWQKCFKLGGGEAKAWIPCDIFMKIRDTFVRDRYSYQVYIYFYLLLSKHIVKTQALQSIYKALWQFYPALASAPPAILNPSSA